MSTNKDFEKRIRFPISDGELKRRYEAVSAAMNAEAVDMLVISNDNQFLGGYLRYFLDIAAEQAYPISAVYFADGELFSLTSSDPTNPFPPDFASRFITKRIGKPYFRSLDYTATYDAEIMCRLAKDKGAKRIGLVGRAELSSAMVDYIRENANAEIVNFTRQIDRIKAVKSAEEMEYCYASVEMHDKAFEYAAELIRPGMWEYELRAELTRWLIEYGSEEQLIMMGSAPEGEKTPHLHSFYQNRRIGERDSVLLMIESNGPGGYYCEIIRTFCMGTPSDDLLEGFEHSKRIQHTLAGLAKPGTPIPTLTKAYNQLLTELGLPEDQRLLMHGQGYDLVEWPGFQPGDDGVIEENMFLAIHPALGFPNALGFCCDNYHITGDGGVLVQKLEQKIFLI
jgi:Xaa-Pro aminopeptidase